MRIKVCGIRQQKQLDALINMGVEMIGFNLYSESKRYVENDLKLPGKTKTKFVGVFVNESLDYILDKKERYQLDYAQLHGNESVELCSEVSQHMSVIKAFGINEKFDFSTISEFTKSARYILLDNHSPDFGGSGNKFNWDKLQEYQYDTPYILSGGISQDDAQELLRIQTQTNCWGIDINSKFETAPAVKDIELISSFQSKISK